MKKLLILLSLAGATCFCQAQDDFESFRKRIHKDFQDFRHQILEEYTDFLRNPWKDFHGDEPVVKPDEKPVPPVVAPIDEPVKSDPVIIDDVIKPIPVTPQPKPISPIEENEERTEPLTFEFFGTSVTVRVPRNMNFSVTQLDENSLADAFTVLTGSAYDNLLYDCLEMRQSMKLCDWAYIQFLRMMSDAACGKGTNEAELLMAAVYVQSGYRMRLAHDGNRLYMLYASRHNEFGKTFYGLDNENYYALEAIPYNLKISLAKFPKEKSLSLLIPYLPKLEKKLSHPRTIQSKKYPEVKETVQTNSHLMDFFSTYPCSYYNDEVMSQWSQYAETPLDDENDWKNLAAAISGKSEYEAVSRLLNWVQTGLEYGYDTEIWGEDRVFFADETLHYPYCDCEDRSILFTRLVRNLLHLDCLLIYYPGHLAAAVKFTEPVEGDYIVQNGAQFVVCDPTYIGAPVGRTMPDMDNQKATVIRLSGKKQ